MAPLLLCPLLAGECELEDDFDVNGDNSAQLLAAANAANNAQAIITTLLEEYENIFYAFGGDDSDVGSPRINLTATAKSNPPVDSQSLRESDIQLNMFLLDFILLFYFF
ncbi:rho GTPase-activating protein 7-like [Camellia sinensis]|uniref:rho GTPase-activating protein 7-like n=1 Tax=Camellia sinensis TaxID=4442 RepID=UPI001036C2D5|nr:rho GTPase-activating protein 7-like [Camellia sinensis]